MHLDDLFSSIPLALGESNISGMVSFVQCSSYGAYIVLNISLLEGKLCVWAKVSEGRLKLSSYGATNIDGVCDGHGLGSLIIKTNDIKAFEEKIGNSELSNKITEMASLGRGLYKISFEEN